MLWVPERKLNCGSRVCIHDTRGIIVKNNNVNNCAPSHSNCNQTSTQGSMHQRKNSSYNHIMFRMEPPKRMSRPSVPTSSWRKRKRTDLSLTPIEKEARAEKKRNTSNQETTLFVLVFHEKLLPIEKKDFERLRAQIAEKMVRHYLSLSLTYLSVLSSYSPILKWNYVNTKPKRDLPPRWRVSQLDRYREKKKRKNSPLWPSVSGIPRCTRTCVVWGYSPRRTCTLQS